MPSDPSSKRIEFPKPWLGQRAGTSGQGMQAGRCRGAGRGGGAQYRQRHQAGSRSRGPRAVCLNAPVINQAMESLTTTQALALNKHTFTTTWQAGFAFRISDSSEFCDEIGRQGQVAPLSRLPCLFPLHPTLQEASWGLPCGHLALMHQSTRGPRRDLPVALGLPPSSEGSVGSADPGEGPEAAWEGRPGHLGVASQGSTAAAGHLPIVPGDPLLHR